MKVTVEFTCPECGLWTPGIAELPDDVDQRRRVTLTHECHHCGAELSVTARVADLIKNKKG